jgi:thymidylate kinase
LLAFHQRVREAYLAWATDHSDVSMVANASQPAEAVHAAILSALGLEPE